MTPPTLAELAERLAHDERIGVVTIEHERAYRAAEGYEATVSDTLTLIVTRRGEPASVVVLDPGFLRLGPDDRVIGATLAVDKPYWAVQAVQRALEIDP